MNVYEICRSAYDEFSTILIIDPHEAFYNPVDLVKREIQFNEAIEKIYTKSLEKAVDLIIEDDWWIDSSGLLSAIISTITKELPEGVYLIVPSCFSSYCIEDIKDDAKNDPKILFAGKSYKYMDINGEGGMSSIYKRDGIHGNTPPPYMCDELWEKVLDHNDKIIKHLDEVDLDDKREEDKEND